MDVGAPDDAQTLENYERLVVELQEELASLDADNERLSAMQNLDVVRANLMKPYANKVFNFLVAYCTAIGVMLVFAGFRVWGFYLSDPILGIIAGSTAVSAIGLVGWVVKGIFGSK
tara:strand:- start:188 stop:535 length:348 start_codon:yes stop_codon:yes gene_type:complete